MESKTFFALNYQRDLWIQKVKILLPDYKYLVGINKTSFLFRWTPKRSNQAYPKKNYSDRTILIDYFKTNVGKMSKTPTQTIFPSMRYCWWNAPKPGARVSLATWSTNGCCRKTREESQRNRVN